MAALLSSHCASDWFQWGAAASFKVPPGSSLVFLGLPHCPQSWEKWGLWGAVTTYDYMDSDGEGETGWEAADGPLGEKYQFKRQMWEMVLQPGRDSQLLAPAARALMQSLCLQQRSCVIA